VSAALPKSVKKVPQYCYQCVAGPDLLTVKVEDGVATEVEPNFSACDVHPGAGKCCVKAYGIIQKTYSPNRLLQPMKRTNPKKGRNEDPGFVPISWDEAFELIGAKLQEIRARGLVNENGYPRAAASFGGGGIPTYYMGTFPAFLSAWGPVDFSYGSGQGVSCTHSEHLYGELWHRAFTVCPDTPSCDYVLSFGANVEASGGVVGAWRHGEARSRGMKRIQLEPHLSVTGAASAEWVPIKPKTDAAFLFGLLHVLVCEMPREKLDIFFLKHHTGSPYLIGPNGFYLRDPATRKPLLWDLKRNAAVPFDTPDTDPALDGAFTVDAIELGADEDQWTHKGLVVETAFGKLVERMRTYTPEWAEQTCDVRSGTVRRLAHEFVDHARVGATVEVDGEVLPFRPVSIQFGRTVNNGWGAYECCYARTLMACLVGALEVPGGTLGTTVRLNRPATTRQASVKINEDGFMHYPMNPTDKAHWAAKPKVRNAHDTMVPLSANSPWSTALGPTHFSWMFQKESPDENWPKVTPPDIWFCYRTNPSISFWDTKELSKRIAEFPFVVAFAYHRDETNHMADVLLPECTDIESTQLIRVGGSKFIEQFWDHEGFALRQPAVAPAGETRDFTDIATELAARAGLLREYNEAINRGAAGVPLSNHAWDFKLDPERKHPAATIWDHACRAASAELTEGRESDGLDWFKQHGLRTRPISRLSWYLFPELRKQGIRFEMPFQERLYRVGLQLGRRLHEQGIHWWDVQLEEYGGLPKVLDFPGIWEKETVRQAGAGALEQYPFWLITSRSMQYAWGSNAAIPLMNETSGNVRGSKGVLINRHRAEALGIAEGDLVEVSSYVGTTRGPAVLAEGIRPDTLLMMGQFDHWATPYAKDLKKPSMNSLIPMSMALTDSTGSGADIVRVGVKKLGATT
jgi:phenylacetyl-CoA:acceptor oxidoreductase